MPTLESVLADVSQLPPPEQLALVGRILHRLQLHWPEDVLSSEKSPQLNPNERDAQELWTQCLSSLSERISPQIFDVWFRHTRGLQVTPDKLIVSVDSAFGADWLNNHYQAEIETALHQHTMASLEVVFHPRSSPDVEAPVESTPSVSQG